MHVPSYKMRSVSLQSELKKPRIAMMDLVNDEHQAPTLPSFSQGPVSVLSMTHHHVLHLRVIKVETVVLCKSVHNNI